MPWLTARCNTARCFCKKEIRGWSLTLPAASTASSSGMAVSVMSSAGGRTIVVPFARGVYGDQVQCNSDLDRILGNRPDGADGLAVRQEQVVCGPQRRPKVAPARRVLAGEVSKNAGDERLVMSRPPAD